MPRPEVHVERLCKGCGHHIKEGAVSRIGSRYEFLGPCPKCKSFSLYDATTKRTESTDEAGLAARREEIGRELALKSYEDGQVYDAGRVLGEAKFYLAQAAVSFIELGKRLILLKEHEPHGRFTEMVEEDLNISPRWAQQAMAVARKFAHLPNANSGSLLGPKKLIALLDVPDEDLQDLEASGTILGRTLDEIDRMSVRELRAAVRAAGEREGKGREQLLAKQKEADEAREELKRLTMPQRDGDVAKWSREARRQVDGLLGRLEVWLANPDVSETDHDAVLSEYYRIFNMVCRRTDAVEQDYGRIQLLAEEEEIDEPLGVADAITLEPPGTTEH